MIEIVSEVIAAVVGAAIGVIASNFNFKRRLTRIHFTILDGKWDAKWIDIGRGEASAKNEVITIARQKRFRVFGYITVPYDATKK